MSAWKQEHGIQSRLCIVSEISAMGGGAMMPMLFFRFIHLLLLANCSSCLFSHFLWQGHHNTFITTRVYSSQSNQSNEKCSWYSEDQTNLEQSFNDIVLKRYACTRFHRYFEQQQQEQTQPATSSSFQPMASISDPTIVQKAIESLDYSRRSPSGFNAQPYRVIVVHNTQEKQALSQYCLGRNADRVRDSDCTMIFLADKEIARGWKRFGQFLVDNGGGRRRIRQQNQVDDTQDTIRVKKKIQQSIFKAQALVLLFSSGWPLPPILALPISFVIRLTVSFISVISRRKILVPSLASADTWATKNTMLVAMTFMLGCTARGLATCPMEGFNAGGIRKVLQIPKRYAIPLIVSVGLPFSSAVEENDDAGMSHAPVGNSVATPRYPLEEVVFDSTYGKSIFNIKTNSSTNDFR